VFDSFKKRAPRQGAAPGNRAGREMRGKPMPSLAPVSAEVKNSLLARAGRGGALRMKELEVAKLLIEHPQLAAAHAETLAALVFTDRSLDRLRHELLNLAASGFGLEKGALENHLVRVGLGELVARLAARNAASAGAEGEDLGEDFETRWLRATAQLRELAELEPERHRAMERFKHDGTEESWRDAHRLFSGTRD